MTLDARGPGFDRKARRQRMGGNGGEHFDEVEGASEFFIYVAPNMSTKGYDGLKSFLNGLGCEVEFPAVAPLTPGPRHQAVKITNAGELIPTAGLKARPCVGAYPFLPAQLLQALCRRSDAGRTLAPPLLKATHNAGMGRWCTRVRPEPSRKASERGGAAPATGPRHPDTK